MHARGTKPMGKVLQSSCKCVWERAAKREAAHWAMLLALQTWPKTKIAESLNLQLLVPMERHEKWDVQRGISAVPHHGREGMPLAHWARLPTKGSASAPPAAR